VISRLTYLKHKLENLQSSNKGMWEMYGSELCAGDMIKQENKLRDLIKEEETKNGRARRNRNERS
jgi:hypothetical protein